MKFTHLHTHSHYSLLDGMSKIDDMVKMAKEHGMTAIGLTDHGVMYGAIDFYTACKKNGIKPIIGVEAYVANRSRLQKEPHIDNKRYHLTLLAKDNAGYQNLIKLTTAAHIEGYYYKPRVDKDLLRTHSEGLIALSGCPGSELGRAIQSGNKEKAEEIIKEYQSIFGPENYYLEIMHHPDVEFFQDWKNTLIEFSRKLNIPLVATQDSHYLHPDDALAHKTLVAISTNTDIGDTAIFSGNGRYHFISTEEALEWFKDIPEAVENTGKIAERCNVNLTLGKFIFPDFPLEEGKTANDKLRELAYAGIASRGVDGRQDVIDRLEYELGIIKFKNYAPYFLVVEDLIRFAADNNIYTNIRGSVAGSMTTYLLGITKLNPIDYNIPFERFLNPDRPSAPDIDMDFADNRRGEVIDYAKKKYGADKVAQIGTFGTMLARGAVRDVARATGKSYETGDRIAKLIPMGSQGFPMTINRAMDIEPGLKDLYDRDLEARQILDIAKKLEGTVRHISVHAAGIVISPQPLTEYVPVQFDPKGEENIITQYDMYTVGEDGVGLTKLDFLGIRNLAILENAVRLVKVHRNLDIDIENIPLNDKRTFAMLARGETEGLFQLNGDGMTKHLIDLKPTTIHDINAMVALYRPGPIQFIPEYIRRKHNPRLISYLDPALESILKQTYGILVYQDDLLIMAHDLAGYSWGEVDKFRKAVGKKIPEEMAKQKEKFIKGCVEHSKWSQKKAEEVWAWIEPFAAYGFNKAHSASYGRVAYQTAYMKANFPAEYMCAVLTAEAGDTEKISEVITECQRMSIPVLPPNINSSFKDFTVIKNPQSTVDSPRSTDQIRFGLLTIKNLGENIAGAIIAERQINGPYKNIEEFVTRVHNKDLNPERSREGSSRTKQDAEHIRSFVRDSQRAPASYGMNKKSVESLIRCGALDEFGDRNVLLINMENLLSFARDKQKQSSMGQVSLFGNADKTELPPFRLSPAEPAKPWEKLMWEKELLGLFVSDHPLNSYQTQLKFENVVPIKNITTRTAGSIKIGGMITRIQKITTKTGRPMMFANVEDLASKIEMVVFPNVYEKNPEAWKENAVIVARGKINDRDGSLKFLCDEVKPLALPAVL
ncbi:MAG: DNA polymerase III subunit alpha [Candidatus Yanofskybacteria bacterium]|nr:DNA polymerase III subunit alpha [Candidatus Yanofskybacteria bacterium]